MKIFAKRTKKKAEPSAKRTVNKSDPVVAELLKKDPSEWNAREKRMVKRYRKRKSLETTEQPDAMIVNEAEKTEDPGKENVGQNEDSEQEESESNDRLSRIDDQETGSSDSSSSSDDEENNEDKDEEVHEEEVNTSNDAAANSNNVDTQKIVKDNKDKECTSEKENDADEGTKVSKDHEIWGVLEKLNSKQKRTLSRKLDRMGISVLEEVEEEANKILDKCMPIESDSKRTNAEAASTDKNVSNETTEPKAKKRKKKPDWSSLPAEERLRREEQRRKQQEAQERRSRGEYIKPGHQRPLNSMRRRANRRKPKWAPKTTSGAPDISDYKRDHHSSGFLHRKNRPTSGQEVTNY